MKESSMAVKKAFEYLIEYKKLSKEDLAFLDKKAAFPEEQICLQGLATQDELEYARALEIGLEIREDLQDLEIPPSIREKLSLSFLKKHLVFPLEERENEIIICVARPFNADVIEELYQQLKKPLIRVYTPKNLLLEALERSYREQKATKSGEQQFIEQDVLNVHDLFDESSNSVVSTLNTIFIEAIRKKVSDIHLEPKGQVLSIRYRIDGVLVFREETDLDNAQSLISRLKVMAQLDISERRLPQDGRMKLIFAGKTVDCRVSSLPTSGGERIVVRLLDRESLAFNDLGMSSVMKESFRKILQSREGIVLVSGPTGSGKTTTLYSAIEELRSSEINIMTIEDPIEYKIDEIAQMAVHPKIDLSFARGLRHILRQDPDIIFIGEIRDQETAQIAIQASLTGHLVLSTLHSNDSPSAVTRLLDMGIEPYLISSSLLGVLSQRLLRRLCPHCRYACKAKEGASLAKLDTVYLARGCERCLQTGTLGRIAIYELLPFSETLKQHILEKTDAHTLKQLAEKEGFVSLFQNGLDLVRQGLCSFDELIRVTHNQRMVF